jgi:hypothetical protein
MENASTVHVNSRAMLNCSVIPPPKETAKLCFYKTCSIAIFLVGSTSINLCFFLNQTVISVAANEPHPRPHYQTGGIFNLFLLLNKCLFFSSQKQKTTFDMQCNISCPKLASCFKTLKYWKLKFAGSNFRLYLCEHLGFNLPNSQLFLN